MGRLQIISIHRASLLQWTGLLLVLAATWMCAGDIVVSVTKLPSAPSQVLLLKDSSNGLFIEYGGAAVWRSSDRGKTWSKVSGVNVGARLISIAAHPYAVNTAYILSAGTTHMKTTDGGNNWSTFKTPYPLASRSLEFHATEPNHIIALINQPGPVQRTHALYTTNGFSTSSMLIEDATSCRFGQSSKEMRLVDARTVLCMVWKAGRTQIKGPLDRELVKSSDYFKSNRVSINFSGLTTLGTGVLGIGVIQKFVVAAVMPDSPSADLDLYVSLDANNWAMAQFPLHSRLKENAYTLLESTPYSLTVDVLTSNSDGTLYTSNSNGTYFTESLSTTHRSPSGKVDFERVDWMPNVMLVNQREPLTNAIVSRISWDEGANWHPLAPPEKSCSRANDCSLHLHSVSQDIGVLGKIYSEKSSPGVLTGVGNVGAQLAKYDEADVFVSTDGGVTWKFVMQEAHHYRQLDSGSVLVLVDNERPTDTIKYSTNMGASFRSFKLPFEIQARTLMTDESSLSSSLLLLGPDRGTRQFSFVHVDFINYFSRMCNDGDYEDWSIHFKGDCIMGRKMTFRRLKQGSECLAGRTSIPEPRIVKCACEDDDFECDLNFVKDSSGNCVLAPGAVDPLMPKVCDTKYRGSSGYRKIPGNVCEGGVKKDEPVERECSFRGQVLTFSEKLSSPAHQHITIAPSTVIVRLENGEVHRSSDGGHTWSANLHSVAYITKHEHVPPRLFAYMQDGTGKYSEDGGNSFKPLNLPGPLDLLQSTFDFHPVQQDWLLVNILKDCPGAKCHSEVYVSKNNGGDWSLLDTYTEKCLFSQDVEFQRTDKEMVYCTAYTRKDGSQTSPEFQNGNSLNLMSYRQFDGSTRKVMVENAVTYHVTHGFLVVASLSDNEVKIRVSMDGLAFTEVEFPPSLKLDHRSFTLLSSSATRAFLDVMRSGQPGREHGVLFISNESGVQYSVSLQDTNRGGPLGATVDFYRPDGFVGGVVANQIVNAEELRQGRASKKMVRTLISWNDGGRWDKLPSTECDDFCFVNLNLPATSNWPSFTSMSSAGGIFVAVGTSGGQNDFLLPFSESDTFLTVDGGRTWKRVARGPHRSAILDNGGIIMLVPDGSAAEVLYSWNYGQSWEIHKLDTPMRISSVVQHENGTTPFVLLYGRGDTDRVVTIDFSEFARPCTKDDFTEWTPTGRSGDLCQLGKQYHYQRRKPESRCLIKVFPEAIRTTSCECGVDDFECDVGYWRNEAGRCILQGPDPDRPANCVNGTVYIGRSGYRKISASTCASGLDLTPQVEKICGQEHDSSPPIIFHQQRKLGRPVVDLVYTNQQTVLTIDDAGNVQCSPDEGKTWLNVMQNSVGIFSHPSLNMSYAIARTHLHVSRDGGRNFQTWPFPGEILEGVMPLSIHPEEAEWLLFTGRLCLPGIPCLTTTFYTKNAGAEWHELLPNVKSCRWARTRDFNLVARTGIFCSVGSMVAYSEDFFNSKEFVMTNVRDLTVNGEYLVAAISESSGSISLSVSLDAIHMGKALFPGNIDSIQQGLTVLQGHRGALFVDISLFSGAGKGFGSLFKSNLNGTRFSLVQDNTNRNSRGFVDYEPIQGITGISMMNVVTNPSGVSRGIEDKKLRTVISYDDGHTTRMLKPPDVDSRGQKYQCKPGEAACNLHLHSYTERRDPQNVLDSVSAPGLFMGVGSVGEFLLPYDKGNVYVTRDAGQTWHEAVKGAHQYEFGDHGGLLVLVNDETPTTEIKYSLDEGQTFNTLRLIHPGDQPENSPVRFDQITTRPDSTSQKFLLFGTREKDKSRVAHFIDFGSLRQRKCFFDANDIDKSDYEPWHLGSGQCLFGKQVTYYRRKQGRDCSVQDPINLSRQTQMNCECTRQDFECEFNYRLDESGKCVPLQPNPLPPCDGNTYWIQSGYLKHPLSSCQGGQDLSAQSEYRCQSGMSGGAIAAIILVPLAVGGAAFAFMRHRSRVGAINLDWVRIPEMPDWDIGDFFSRCRRRFQYVQLRQTQRHSSTSLLDDD